jgi:predicted metal-dependent enzyme (double-stranded beta helix superfamily)
MTTTAATPLDATLAPVESGQLLPLEAQRNIAAGLAHIQRSVPTSPADDPEAPRSIRLIAADGYDVWLITWPPGSGIGDHDHGESMCVMGIVTGALIESVGTTRRMRQPGTTMVTPPGTTHRLSNSASTETTSLHVYSPPLAAVTYHDDGPAKRESDPRSAPIRSRRAEATSHPSGFHASPHLMVH